MVLLASHCIPNCYHPEEEQITVLQYLKEHESPHSEAQGQKGAVSEQRFVLLYVLVGATDSSLFSALLSFSAESPLGAAMWDS